jgi:hypothetical protein
MLPPFRSSSSLFLLLLVVAGCSLESTTHTDHRAAMDDSANEPEKPSVVRDEAPDAAADDGGSTSANGDAGSSAAPFCEDLVTSTLAYVPVTSEPGAPPELTGGTIVAGTYALTSASSHAVIGSPPPPPPQLRGTMKIATSTLTVAIEPSAGTIHTATLEYSAADGMLTLHPVCFVYENGTYGVPGAGEGSVVEYAATATTITLRVLGSITIEDDGKGNQVVTAKSVEDLVFTR